MTPHIPFLAAMAVFASAGLPLLAAHDKAAPDARAYVLTVEGMT